MDSLTLRFKNEVFLPYLDLLKAEHRFHPIFDYARKTWESKLTVQELINGPYLEKSQIYQDGEALDNIKLCEKTKSTIKERLGNRKLWKHQTDAIKLLLDGQNTVIATGTSSGKTLCYQIPILDDLLRDPAPGLRAVIIYPLNALVNDQLDEWERMLKSHPQVTFARFTGQTPYTQNDYITKLRNIYHEEMVVKQFTQQETQQMVEQKLQERLENDLPNRLNHRDAIRTNPPQILITNFSMLEYLLERPIDASIFENARLKFLVLDEVHAYRGVQATEIAFLIRRLKDRLGLAKLTCIATSATLGKQGDVESQKKVRQFASSLFNDGFNEPNPIYGTPAEPVLLEPYFNFNPEQYLKIIDILRDNPHADVGKLLGVNISVKDINSLLDHDRNIYRLRKEILTKPILLKDAAQFLWPNNLAAEDGLLALLEIVATVKVDESHEDLLPTRLHYFVKAQDGLYLCLHKYCPGRRNEKPAIFVSRHNGLKIPEGECPFCFNEGHHSKLVEIVACRKCGYLYGALQDLGPRRAQNQDNTNKEIRHHFDSFSTELGWAGDSYWSYFSVDNDLPYPTQPKYDPEEDEPEDLFLHPAELEWCVICGKKKDNLLGDNCECKLPHLRRIKIFHRQCPHSGKAKDRANLYNQEKTLLNSCPNCGAKNSSGIEPVHRFQESDDEMGLAMAIPLAHFQVTPQNTESGKRRKLLCFTDNRQRAAAFPSLLEEETFAHDMGRKIVEIVNKCKRTMNLTELGEYLAEIADSRSEKYDSEFFLPISRYPDEELDAKAKRKLWIAETFAYFGIPDSARESAEDLGLVVIECNIKEGEKTDFQKIFKKHDLTIDETYSLLQILLGYLRHRKVFTLPKNVEPDSPAFGRVTADIAYVLRREGLRNTNGWLPHGERENIITDYLRKVFELQRDETLSLAKEIWELLIKKNILIRSINVEKWKIDHDRILVGKPTTRYICNRCGIVTAFSVKQKCPKKECEGVLEAQLFDPNDANIIARWVAGVGKIRFSTLKSEEHTAQINKDLAKKIEDKFRAEALTSNTDINNTINEIHAEGINLLSSTTTFEMGINIGDLQKVLLRNAPPTSASYIQRVGRTGRGKDKNSVCVTLCRQTKYDADAWDNPSRLMSGEVRTPTVFTQNKVIAQRHFNAVVFAKFLRIKIADISILNQLQQKMRLEPFLPLDIRSIIPAKWKQNGNKYMDFINWLDQSNVNEVFQTDPGRTLISAVSNYDAGKTASQEKYKSVIGDIGEELSSLMFEFNKMCDQYELKSALDIEQAIKNILANDIIEIMAKHGFLPRYAFPLDVVTLETGRTRWSRVGDVELNRDRGIAIAEFAPGAQVIANKKVFTSAGLYVVSKADKPKREWYSKCPNCEQIRTAQIQDTLIGPCSVCGKQITRQYIHPFVEPLAFSVRIDQKGSPRYRRSTLIRQRQTLTHFIDMVDSLSFHDNGLFQITVKEAGKLFRYNLGPENKGFMLCPECGSSEPLSGYKAGTKHKRLRTFSGILICQNEMPWITPLAYGHQFESYCLVARPCIPPPSVESLAFALQRGLCITLDLEPSDIGVSWRWLSKRDSAACSEIILYDLAPGGAGFVKEGFENWEEVIKNAKEICNKCTCENACYNCLKSYSNQSYHEKLDRRGVIDFMKQY